MTNVIDFTKRRTDGTISQVLLGSLRENGIRLDEVSESLRSEYGGHRLLSYGEIVNFLFNFDFEEPYGWEEIERLLRSQSAEFHFSRMKINIALLKKHIFQWWEIEEIAFRTRAAPE